MAVEWDEGNAAHLLRRATFGPRSREIERAVKRGMGRTIDDLFKPDRRGDGFPRRVKKSDNLTDLQGWWLRRMLGGRGALNEKLTLLWHNHFATSVAKVEDLYLMHLQNRTLRSGALGSFRDLLAAMARDPAMLIWLDNETNIAANPNENFARELMELFSTGVVDSNGNANYTERDVEEAARAFTGWTRDDDAFFFDTENHDFGEKTFRGLTGSLDGVDVIDQLASDPATARRVAWRLFSFFAHPVELDDPVLDEFAAEYLAADTTIRPVVERLFRSDAFYSDRARRGHVKSPAEFVVGLLRQIGARVRSGKEWALAEWTEALGQALFAPPTVFGWKEHLAWVATPGLLGRAEFAAYASRARGQRDALKFDPRRLLGNKRQRRKLDASAVVDRVVSQLGPVATESATRDALIAYVETDFQGQRTGFVPDGASIDVKVRGLVALVASSPEFQVN